MRPRRTLAGPSALALATAALLFLAPGLVHGFDPPHTSAQGVDCSDCHKVHNAPGPSLTSAASNANLCISICHKNGAPLASGLPFADSMQAKPGQRGTSHAWNGVMPALSDPANAYGLRNTADLSSPVLRYQLGLYDDVVTCSVCHAQHIQSNEPWDPASSTTYVNGVTDDRRMMRIGNAYNEMCVDCHYYRDASRYASPHDEELANGTTVFSHPVSNVLGAAPLDAKGSPQTNSPSLPLRYAGDADGVPGNELVLDSQGRVQCLSCHAVHYSDSNSMTNAADIK